MSSIWTDECTKFIRPTGIGLGNLMVYCASGLINTL